MSAQAWFMLSIWPVTWIVLPGESSFLRPVVEQLVEPAKLLKRAFLGWLRGERRHCSMAHIPTLGEEDAQRPYRERECLVKKRTRFINRMKGTLARLGIRDFKPALRKAAVRLAILHTPEGSPLSQKRGRFDRYRSASVQRGLKCATRGATRMLALALCCWAFPGGAKPPKSISVELNKLEQEGGSCRAYLVIANPGTDAFSAFTLDLVIFDSGTIMRRLAIELAPIRPAKTSVKVFDIPQTACGSIGSILVNDVTHCRDASGDVADCVDWISTSSKLSVTLSK